MRQPIPLRPLELRFYSLNFQGIWGGPVGAGVPQKSEFFKGSIKEARLKICVSVRRTR